MKNFLRYKKKGVTLVEIMMVVAVMGVLFLGVFSLLNKVTKGTWRISGTLGMTDAASEAMYWIGNDFRNAKASSMGNCGPVSGFEEPSNSLNPPNGWEALNSCVRRLSGNGPSIKGGLMTITLEDQPTTYYSNTFTIPTTKNYLLSGFARNHPQAAIKLVKADNTDFAPLVKAVKTTDYWEHISTTTLRTQAEQAKIALVHPNNMWDSVGPNMWRKPVYSLAVFNDKLYVAANIGVWEYDGSNWNYTAIGTGANSLCEYNNKLYAGGAGWNTINISVFNGASWSPAYSAFDNGGTVMVLSMCVYNGKLYAGTGSSNGNAKIYVYDGVSWNLSWNANNYAPGMDNYVHALCVYNGKLYAGIGNLWNDGGAVRGGICVFDGISWSESFADNGSSGKVSNTDALCVYNNRLYAATRYYSAPNSISFGMFSYDGTSWTNCVFPGGTWTVFSLNVYKNRLWGLYINPPNTDVYTYDGSWTNIGTIPNSIVDSLCKYRGQLYAGVRDYPMGWPFGLSGHLYIYYDSSLFDDVSFSPLQVTFSSSTIVSTDTDYEYYTSQGTNENDVQRFKRYRLHYDQSVRKLYRQKYTGPGPNDWQNESPAPLCENVSWLTITNNKQESFDVELILEKVIDASQTKEYRVKSRFTPAVP